MPRTPEPPTPETVLDHMQPCIPYFAGELADDLPVSRRTVSRRLQVLVDDGRVRKKKYGERRAVYWCDE